MIWVFLSVIISALSAEENAKDLFQQEMDATQQLIQLLQYKLQTLTETYSSLNITSIPKGNDWKSLLPDSNPNSFANLLNLRASVEVIFIQSSDIIDFDFFPLPGKETQYGLAVCKKNGILELYSMANELIYRHSLDHSPLYCAASQTSDDIRFASISHSEIRVYKLITPAVTKIPEYFGLQSSSYNFTIISDGSDNLFNEASVLPTAFMFYTRLGKKNWIVGDDKGGVNYYYINGKQAARGIASQDSITSFDRLGQQLVFGSKYNVGVFNTATLETHILCERTIHPIVAMTIDYNGAVVHAALKNGDIISYDTKFSQNSSPVTCKAISRFFNPYLNDGVQMRSIRGSLLVWSSSDILSVYSTSFIDKDELNPPQYYAINHLKNSANPILRVLRLSATAFYIAITGNSNNKLLVFDTSVNMPKFAASNEGFNIDLGYIRFIGYFIYSIAIAIVFVIVWRVKNRPNPKQQKLESLGKTIDDLEETMKGMKDMSSGLTSRLSNLEGASKKNVRFQDKPNVFRYQDDIED